jgi:hypothetical protein
VVLFHSKCFRKDVCGICQDSGWGMGWKRKEMRFDSWHGYEILLLARVSILALGITQDLIQLALVLFLSSVLVLQLGWHGAVPPISHLSSYAQAEL